MTISMYRSQRDRLTKELSTLRGKLASENSRVSDDRAKARRSAEAMRRATSASSAQSKSRELERHEKSASQHEDAAVRLEGQIAAKRKALSTAETNLERAEAEQRKRDERAQDKRRKEELAHVRRLESERRSSQVWPTGLRARAVDVPITVGRVDGARPTYDVCLSFAGEQRGYVELVASDLKHSGLRVFYDQDEDVLTELWGKDLTETLDYVYRVASRFCVMFISAEYAEKEWARHERRSALDRAVREEDDYLLPVRFDDTDLPGLRPSVAYLDLREIAPATLADFIRGKVRPSVE